MQHYVMSYCSYVLSNAHNVFSYCLYVSINDMCFVLLFVCVKQCTKYDQLLFVSRNALCVINSIRQSTMYDLLLSICINIAPCLYMYQHCTMSIRINIVPVLCVCIKQCTSCDPLFSMRIKHCTKYNRLLCLYVASNDLCEIYFCVYVLSKASCVLLHFTFGMSGAG